METCWLRNSCIMYERKTKDCARSWTFQPKSWHICLLLWCLPNFLTIRFPSINYDLTHLQDQSTQLLGSVAFTTDNPKELSVFTWRHSTFQIWTLSLFIIAPIEQSDLFGCLVIQTSFYTNDQLKNYRTLEACNQVVSGFVASLSGKIISNKTRYSISNATISVQRCEGNSIETRQNLVLIQITWCVVFLDLRRDERKSKTFGVFVFWQKKLKMFTRTAGIIADSMLNTRKTKRDRDRIHPTFITTILNYNLQIYFALLILFSYIYFFYAKWLLKRQEHDVHGN